MKVSFLKKDPRFSGRDFSKKNMDGGQKNMEE